MCNKKKESQSRVESSRVEKNLNQRYINSQGTAITRSSGWDTLAFLRYSAIMNEMGASEREEVNGGAKKQHQENTIISNSMAAKKQKNQQSNDFWKKQEGREREVQIVVAASAIKAPDPFVRSRPFPSTRTVQFS